jgi:hypothetical protein
MKSWPVATDLFLMEKRGSTGTPTWALHLAGLAYFAFIIKPTPEPCTAQHIVPFSIAIFDF